VDVRSCVRCSGCWSSRGLPAGRRVRAQVVGAAAVARRAVVWPRAPAAGSEALALAVGAGVLRHGHARRTRPGLPVDALGRNRWPQCPRGASTRGGRLRSPMSTAWRRGLEGMTSVGASARGAADLAPARVYWPWAGRAASVAWVAAGSRAPHRGTSRVRAPCRRRPRPPCRGQVDTQARVVGRQWQAPSVTARWRARRLPVGRVRGRGTAKAGASRPQQSTGTRPLRRAGRRAARHGTGKASAAIAAAQVVSLPAPRPARHSGTAPASAAPMSRPAAAGPRRRKA
jgi:hypothetical protein